MVVGCIALSIALFAPTFLAGWAPLLHHSCDTSGVAGTSTLWVPLSILNAPYGGKGFVNSSIPSGFFGTSANTNPPNLVGGWAGNGSVWGGFYKVNATVYYVSNSTEWGPGSNVACRDPFAISLRSVIPGQGYEGELFTWPGAPLFGPNSSSDQFEPNRLYFSSAPGDSSAYFSNGFTLPNLRNLTTCGLPAKTFSTSSTGLTIRIPFDVGGRNETQSLTLPWIQSFNYWFPSNFGVWQVDDLSAPGGPGGGWAFSYSPCP